MSINNFSSDNQNNPWWTQQEHKNTPTSQLSWLHSQESSSTQHYDTNEDIETETNNSSQEQQYQHPQEVQEFQKRTMFEKPLTPSDVGKLNRLVIPKQHAEKHFPLSGDSIDKGLLLSFEDELGKSWKFRYSYWNSSQSYVLTKGWSRYVKEKSLDAGDVVFFARHRMDSERLFIGWRRRGTVSANAAAPPQDGGALATYNSGGGGDGGWSRMMVRAGQGYPYPRQHQHGHGAHVPYQSDSMHAESVVQHHQITAATTSSSGSRTLRLFGVNLECQLEESEPSTPDSSSWSSQSQGHTYHHQMQQYYSQLYNSSHQSHMDISFCEDGKQMRDHRG